MCLPSSLSHGPQKITKKSLPCWPAELSLRRPFSTRRVRKRPTGEYGPRVERTSTPDMCGATLSRHYFHVLSKKFAKIIGFHEDMVHCHTVRHSAAMRIYERTH